MDHPQHLSAAAAGGVPHTAAAVGGNNAMAMFHWYQRFLMHGLQQQIYLQRQQRYSFTDEHLLYVCLYRCGIFVRARVACVGTHFSCARYYRIFIHTGNACSVTQTTVDAT